jgi:nucleoid-associated protein YgaU
MTSDAKIGLLLGLVFIFIIAFIINGLPSFRKNVNNNELTTNMVGSQNNPPGLAAKERRVRREVIEPTKLVYKQPLKVQTPPMDNQDIRFTTPLPKSPSAMKETVVIKPAVPVTPSPTVDKRHKAGKSNFVKPTLPKVYVVGENDSLAVIAKKFYGPDNGNKIINITRVFEANRKLLKSPDEIYPGQKLIIPPLSASHRDKNKIDSVFSSTIFKKVKSIGRRRLSTDGRRRKQSRQHIVREGDNLWSIAAEQLGDGHRYREIAKVNADIRYDEDSLTVGMRLKMPVQ